MRAFLRVNADLPARLIGAFFGPGLPIKPILQGRVTLSAPGLNEAIRCGTKTGHVFRAKTSPPYKRLRSGQPKTKNVRVRR